MAKKQKTDYRGKLTEPLSLLPEAGHPAGESAPAIADLRKSEVAERLLLLLRHYGIDLSDPDHWYKLALCLACHHVPGLKVEQRGSEKDWGLQMEKKLYTDVTRFINGQKHTARSACHHLAKKRPYPERPTGTKIGTHGCLMASRRFSSSMKAIRAAMPSKTGFQNHASAIVQNLFRLPSSA